MSNPRQKRILVVAAHPDDCELKVGGCAALWRKAGFAVTLLSMTNGDTGHHQMGGGVLAIRRAEEAARAAAVIGAESRVLDIHNGELEPSLASRRLLMQVMREVRPDLILTHRPWDYHPDHRYTGQLVHDAAHSVTVPNVVALSPPIQRNPVVLYLADRFRKPYPFQPDFAVDISAVIETKIEMVAQHVSQMYEWLPYSGGYVDEVPTSEAERRNWLDLRLRKRFSGDADACRERLIATYGVDRGQSVEYAESFEVCEYGSQPSETFMADFFPFV